MKEIIEILREKNKTISTMESCTGGMLAAEITNIPNSSLVFKFGAVTYSNEFKIKMNVSKELIDKYSVYSEEVAKDMSYQISLFTNSDYGIGITGKLNYQDINNMKGDNNCVYFSIYDRANNIYFTDKIIVLDNERVVNKQKVINTVVDKIKSILLK